MLRELHLLRLSSLVLDAGMRRMKDAMIMVMKTIDDGVDV